MIMSNERVRQIRENDNDSIDWDRPILIGSCPSSGSTLLSVMLDAHPDILCGPELSLFSHPIFWTGRGVDWQNTLLKRMGIGHDVHSSVERLLSDGFCPYASLVFGNNLPWYNLTEDKLKNIIQNSTSAHQLIKHLYLSSLRSHSKRVWAEKSPPNLYSFKAFLEYYPKGRVIYIVRDGRDVVSSLQRRNFGFKRALAIWLVETAICELYYEHPRVLRIRYEDLILKTKETVEILLNFLELPIGMENILNYRQFSSRVSSDVTINVSSWQSNPSQAISNRSIGIWRDDLTLEQLTTFASAYIVHAPIGYPQLIGQTASGMLKRLGYEPIESGETGIEELLQFIDKEKLFLSGNDYVDLKIFQERFVECDIKRLPKVKFSWETARLRIKLENIQKEYANIQLQMRQLETFYTNLQKQYDTLQVQFDSLQSQNHHILSLFGIGILIKINQIPLVKTIDAMISKVYRILLKRK